MICADSGVDALRGGIREGLVLHDLATEEDMLLAGAEINRTNLFAHAPETDHAPREPVACLRSLSAPVVISSKVDHLRRAAAERDGEPPIEVRSGETL